MIIIILTVSYFPNSHLFCRASNPTLFQNWKASTSFLQWSILLFQFIKTIKFEGLQRRNWRWRRKNESKDPERVIANTCKVIKSYTSGHAVSLTWIYNNELRKKERAREKKRLKMGTYLRMGVKWHSGRWISEMKGYTEGGWRRKKRRVRREPFRPPQLQLLPRISECRRNIQERKRGKDGNGKSQVVRKWLRSKLTFGAQPEMKITITWFTGLWFRRRVRPPALRMHQSTTVPPTY